MALILHEGRKVTKQWYNRYVVAKQPAAPIVSKPIEPKFDPRPYATDPQKIRHMRDIVASWVPIRRTRQLGDNVCEALLAALDELARLKS